MDDLNAGQSSARHYITTFFPVMSCTRLPALSRLGPVKGDKESIKDARASYMFNVSLAVSPWGQDRVRGAPSVLARCCFIGSVTFSVTMSAALVIIVGVEVREGEGDSLF